MSALQLSVIDTITPLCFTAFLHSFVDALHREWWLYSLQLVINKFASWSSAGDVEHMGLHFRNCLQLVCRRCLIAIIGLLVTTLSIDNSAHAALDAPSVKRKIVSIEAEIKLMYAVYGVVEVGEKQKASEATGAAWIWPVYYDGKTVGYAFNTLEIAPLPGFSGRPIEMLVTINADGTYRDVRVLR